MMRGITAAAKAKKAAGYIYFTTIDLIRQLRLFYLSASANVRDKTGRGKALGLPSLEEFVAQRDYTGTIVIDFD